MSSIHWLVFVVAALGWVYELLAERADERR